MQEVSTVRICIPTETGEGKVAKVHDHFGSAPYFTIYDTERGESESICNGNQHHAHGMCHPLTALGGKDIDVVVCSAMGARALQGLNEGGIRAYRAIAGTVADIVKKYEANELEEILPSNACGLHNCQ
jgi:predicted Fe-Mo cluster-binding NifX family protein